MPQTGPVPEGGTFFCPHCGAMYSVTHSRPPCKAIELSPNLGDGKEAGGGLRLFDHLVSAGEQRRRNGQAERFGGLQVDDEVVLHRRLHRQVGGFLAL